MEAFSALSLTCNIFDMVERAYKGAKIIREIYNAPSGQQFRHVQLEGTLVDLRETWQELKDHSLQGSILRSGARFQEVAQRSQEASDAIQTILDECKSKRPQSLRYAITTFTRSLFKQREIDEQLLKLEHSREALKLHIITSTQYVAGYLTLWTILLTVRK